METRDNKRILLIAAPGTGKTDLTKLLLSQSNLPKKMILDEFDNPVWRNMKTHDHPEWSSWEIPILPENYFSHWNSGLYRHFNSDMKYLLNLLRYQIYNTFLVVEDASRFFGTRLTYDQSRILFNSKQQGNDVLFVFHDIASCPGGLIRNSDYLILGKTGDSVIPKTKLRPGMLEAFQDLKRSKNKHEFKVIKLL